MTHGTCISIREAEPTAEVLDAAQQPLPRLRSLARRTTATSSCAGFACGSSRSAARSPASSRRAGDAMMTDPIADMLTRIRNAVIARHEFANMPHSLLKEHIAASSQGRGLRRRRPLRRRARQEDPHASFFATATTASGDRRHHARLSSPGPPRLCPPRSHSARSFAAWASRSSRPRAA